MKKKYEAFSSIEVLLIIFILSFIISSSGIILISQNKIINKRNEIINEKKHIEKILMFEIEKLKTNDVIDSPFDDFWENKLIEGVDVKIRNLSSLVNINVVPLEIIELILSKEGENENFINYIKLKKQSGELINSFDELSGFIDKNLFDKYFTTYGWYNFNIINTNFVTFILTSLGINDINFIYKHKQLKSAHEFISSEMDFQFYSGINYNDIKPYINIDPILNINFINIDLLQKLLKYNSFSQRNITQITDEIEVTRKSKILQPEQISDLFRISKNEELYYYLGSKTWFCEISLSYENTKCIAIICRLPKNANNILSEDQFCLIEKKWS